MIPLLPKSGVDLDPITCTWLRGLVATALELKLPGMCWHIEHGDTGTVATGYVTVTLLHEATERRKSWADAMGLHAATDEQGRPDGYAGRSGSLFIRLPDAIDPDEHCRACNRPFDPRDTREDGRARYKGGEVCRACMADTPTTVGTNEESAIGKTP